MKKVYVLLDVTDLNNIFIHKGYRKRGWMRKGHVYIKVQLTAGNDDCVAALKEMGYVLPNV